MNSKRPSIERIRQPTLFDLQESSGPSEQPNTERPFSLPGIFLGTSSFTASGWEGSFYPIGTRSKDFLRHYASQFQTVEIDSTFYGTPSASTVTSWNEKTPGDLIFAVNIPQVITHEKVLVDCEPEFDEFIERLHLLDDKLGPMLLQFPKFDRWVLEGPDEFRARLQPFFKRGADLNAGRFAVEVRNKDWLDARLTDLIREHNVALALTDTSFMPRPWEVKGALDLVTADFAPLSTWHDLPRLSPHPPSDSEPSASDYSAKSKFTGLSGIFALLEPLRQHLGRPHRILNSEKKRLA